jgi:P27 family predicted phage terminase small subunit
MKKKPVKKPLKKTPKPPRHLSAATRLWWRWVTDEFVLEQHHLRLLELACRAWDRAETARNCIQKHGLTYKAKNGDIRPRPEVVIERNSMIAFARLLREISLDVPPPGAEVRVPRILGTGA